jgi:hypothetical protein
MTGRMPVGVSILTSGNRRAALERCVGSLLANCYYRPLVVGICNNGSTDDTQEWFGALPGVYGVEWRWEEAESDHGCAWGTNRSIELVRDCECQLHLESDFEHLSPEESGADRMWMHRAVELLASGDCDYLYLRRMRGPIEAGQHWWDQWMPRVGEERGEYLDCSSFWWSNNPALFRVGSLMDNGTLPLDESVDGPKGSEGWSVPELGAKKPRRPWLHRWGVFVHERSEADTFDQAGCGSHGPYGRSGCKYGFWMPPDHRWCPHCDPSEDFKDMPKHRKRVR